MRTKLTDIISTFDQFNEFCRLGDVCKDGVEAYIDIEADDAPATINIKEMLSLNPKAEKSNKHTPYVNEYVKSFDQFINEINQSTYTRTQSYFGCLDDSDDLDEEE